VRLSEGIAQAPIGPLLLGRGATLGVAATEVEAVHFFINI